MTIYRLVYELAGRFSKREKQDFITEEEARRRIDELRGGSRQIRYLKLLVVSKHGELQLDPGEDFKNDRLGKPCDYWIRADKQPGLQAPTTEPCELCFRDRPHYSIIVAGLVPRYIPKDLHTLAFSHTITVCRSCEEWLMGKSKELQL